jgi:hypothetical protein
LQLEVFSDFAVCRESRLAFLCPVTTTKGLVPHLVVYSNWLLLLIGWTFEHLFPQNEENSMNPNVVLIAKRNKYQKWCLIFESKDFKSRGI